MCSVNEETRSGSGLQLLRFSIIAATGNQRIQILESPEAQARPEVVGRVRYRVGFAFESTSAPPPT